MKKLVLAAAILGLSVPAFALTARNVTSVKTTCSSNKMRVTYVSRGKTKRATLNGCNRKISLRNGTLTIGKAGSAGVAKIPRLSPITWKAPASSGSLNLCKISKFFCR